MPNYTELPERRYVEKAKNLSLGGKDSDTYFDGETLETMLTAIQDLQKPITTDRIADEAVTSDKLGVHLYQHKISLYWTNSAVGNTSNTYFRILWINTCSKQYGYGFTQTRLEQALKEAGFSTNSTGFPISVMVDPYVDSNGKIKIPVISSLFATDYFTLKVGYDLVNITDGTSISYTNTDVSFSSDTVTQLI